MQDENINKTYEDYLAKSGQHQSIVEENQKKFLDLFNEISKPVAPIAELRDYFAMAVIPGLIANNKYSYQEVVSVSYEIADLALKERVKGVKE